MVTTFLLNISINLRYAQSKENIFQDKKFILQFMIQYDHKPGPGVMNLDRIDPSLLINKLSISEICPRVEIKFLKDIMHLMHFHSMTNMAMPKHNNTIPKGHEIYKW